MLHRRQCAPGRHELRRAALALKPVDHRSGVLGDQFRRLGIALVGSAPTDVARDGHGRRESPIDARGGHLLRRRLSDPAHQIADRASAPSPTLCGKIVAPMTFAFPCTASMPNSIGMAGMRLAACGRQRGAVKFVGQSPARLAAWSAHLRRGRHCRPRESHPICRCAVLPEKSMQCRPVSFDRPSPPSSCAPRAAARMLRWQDRSRRAQRRARAQDVHSSSGQAPACGGGKRTT